MIYLHIGLTALLFYRLSTSQPKAARDSTEYVSPGAAALHSGDQFCKLPA